MDYPDDPWNTPDLHRNHNHGPEPTKQNATEPISAGLNGNGNGNGVYPAAPEASLPHRTTSTFTTATAVSTVASAPQSSSLGSNPPGWGYYDGNPSSGGAVGGAGDFDDPSNHPVISPFGAGGAGGGGGGREPDLPPSLPPALRPVASGRTGNSLEENIVVTLMPEKEGMFMFQHHNYEVASSRRGSKVVRRYSDFVWLLDCLHKRYPFRALPLLPPKRVAGR